MSVRLVNLANSKVMRYRVTMHGLRMMFEEGSSWKVREGIPEGGRAVGLQLDWDNQNIIVFIEHEDFHAVPEGCIPPDGNVILEAPDYVTK